MFSLTVRIGQAIEIGDEAAIKLEKKSGQMVRMIIGTQHRVRVIPTGIIPDRFLNIVQPNAYSK